MFFVYRQHLPERRRFEASSYSEGGLGSDQRIELRISTETPLDIPPLPLPTIFKRSETSWHTGRSLAKFWVVGRISRTCCKGVDCAGFESLLCASKTAKFGGWLKMYIVHHHRQVSKQSGMWQQLVQSLFDIQWLALHVVAKGQIWYLSLAMVSSHDWDKNYQINRGQVTRGELS